MSTSLFREEALQAQTASFLGSLRVAHRPSQWAAAGVALLVAVALLRTDPMMRMRESGLEKVVVRYSKFTSLPKLIRLTLSTSRSFSTWPKPSPACARPV